MKIARRFNGGFNDQNETSPSATAGMARTFPIRFLSPLRGLVFLGNVNPQLKLRVIFCGLCEAEKAAWPRAGAPGWFFLNKIFRGRKGKCLKHRCQPYNKAS